MTDEITADRIVPIFAVVDINKTIAFYVDGLGFEKKGEWIEDGRLRWCHLEHAGGVGIMAQEYRAGDKPPAERGLGIKMYVWCSDAKAFYARTTARGVGAQEPFVGNGMHVVELVDPDGYQLAFQSPTDEPDTR